MPRADEGSSELPAAIGPWCPVALLGQGGMGVVYRVQNLQTGALAALKTVHLNDPSQLNSLRREITALQGLRHPGVVRILDQGVHENLPWYAMELVEGSTLRQRVREVARLTGSVEEARPADTLVLDLDTDDEVTESREAEPAPLSLPPAAAGELPQILDLAARLCAPLAYLHGEGLVHRDLKPENVLLRRDQSPVLSDFGLLARFSRAGGRERLFQDQPLHGTATYMAPEQIRGELVDARADLYALGIILYELVTGAPPFVSRSSGAVLYHHLEVPAPRASERVTGVPPALEQLLQALLQKRPEDRPGYAEDVARELTALGASPPWEPGFSPRAYLYRPRFTGRSQEVARGRSWIHGEPVQGVQLVVGEPGSGKTRYLLELARIAAQRGAVVLSGEAVGPELPEHGAPLQALARPLREVADWCRHRGQEATRRVLGDKGHLIATLRPELRGLVPTGRVSPRPGSDQSPVWDALDEVLLEWADGEPLVLLIDDVHHADALTLSWLAARRRQPTRGILIVAASSLGAARGGLEELYQAGPDLRLGRLEPEALRSLVADMLALPGVSDDLVKLVTARSAGLPLLASEVLRAALADGTLRRDRRTGWGVGAAPTGPLSPGEDTPPTTLLRRILAGRLEAMEREEQTLVDLAAAGGQSLPWDLLDGALLHLEPATPAARWHLAGRSLAQRQIVDSDGEKLTFLHEPVREVLYERLSAERASQLHRIWAATLLEQDSAHPGAARHLELAGQPEAARRAWAAAARAAVTRGSFGEAVSWFRAAVSLHTPSDPIALDLRRELATSSYRIGQTGEALAELQNLRWVHQGAGDRVREGRVLLELGKMTAVIGRLADALELLDLAAASGAEVGPELPLARSEVLAALGEAEPAKAALDQAEAQLTTLGQRAAWQAAHGRLALMARSFEDATRWLQEAERASLACGDQDMAQEVLLDLARVALEARRAQDAHAHLHRFRQLGWGDPVQRAQADALEGAAYYLDGQRALAEPLLGSALALFQEHGLHRHQAQLLVVLARLRGREGAPQEALALAEHATVLFSAVGDQRQAKDLLGATARWCLLVGNREAARIRAEAALVAARRALDRQTEADAHLILGSLALQAGDAAAARQALERAQALSPEGAVAERSATLRSQLERSSR